MLKTNLLLISLLSVCLKGSLLHATDATGTSRHAKTKKKGSKAKKAAGLAALAGAGALAGVAATGGFSGDDSGGDPSATADEGSAEGGSGSKPSSEATTRLPPSPTGGSGSQH